MRRDVAINVLCAPYTVSGRKWSVGNLIANLFSTRIIKSHPPKFLQMRMDKITTCFPGKRSDPFLSFSRLSLPYLIFRYRTLSSLRKRDFLVSPHALAHAVSLCNGPWTDIDQQLVDSLPRPAAKQHESLLNSQDLRISCIFFLFYRNGVVSWLCVFHDMTF